MEKVTEILKEERKNLELLLAEKEGEGNSKEVKLLYNKQVKLNEVENKIKEYNQIK
jgi:translation initiation factor 2 beta subunit (eIF-2beta)/eIF-5